MRARMGAWKSQILFMMQKAILHSGIMYILEIILESVITGSALTSDITDAEYDENGDAVVGSMKIRRMKKTDANYSSKELAEGFYDWNSLNGGYVYFKYEPMKWRVLQNEGDTLLLLSDMVLDCQYYVRSDRKVKWADCSIRSWLNGYSRIIILAGHLMQQDSVKKRKMQ